jgi:hypothetical protein
MPRFSSSAFGASDQAYLFQARQMQALAEEHQDLGMFQCRLQGCKRDAAARQLVRLVAQLLVAERQRVQLDHVSDRQQQLLLATRKVVEQLALAGLRARPDIVERRYCHAAGTNLSGSALDDALSRSAALRCQILDS